MTEPGTTEPGPALRERRELCDLMGRLGPDAPTLCAGWSTRDLAAHLVVRERRPDAVPGIVLAPLAGYTARVQRSVAQRPWPQLLATLRSGPPRWSPMRLPPLAAFDLVEFFVHHEDVRRARPRWRPREADPARAEALWALLRMMARRLYRNSPVGVRLRRTDQDRASQDGTGQDGAGQERGGPEPGGGAAEITAGAGTGAVTLAGTPEELVLHAYGRDEVLVRFSGEQADIAALQASSRSV